jgi:rod shape-determining protein MreD
MLITIFFILGILLIVAQTTFLQLSPDWFGRPDFLYILVAFAAYRFRWISGLIFVFILGWMLDIVSGIHPGIYPLQNIVVFSSLKLLTENSPMKESTYQVPLVGISYFIVQIGFFSLYSMMMPETLPEWSWNRIIQEAFILLLATIPSFVILNYFYEFFNTRRVIHRVMSKRSGNQFR